ncbi:MAG: hypothetical protein WDZ45_01110 [Flavobacteriaceae bacterium]
MKFIHIIIYFLFILSCKSAGDTKDGNNCVENTEFKEKFFYHFNYIENNISVLQDSKFKESVIFISNYAPVSTNNIMNYSRTYPIGIFEKDRIKILEWYEENKCNNIQFKSTYIIPDAYKDYEN